MKVRGKMITIIVLVAVMYFVIFGSGTSLNELEFEASEVRSAEILDDWNNMSPAKYNPDGVNVSWLQTWIERGYVPVLTDDEVYPQEAGLPIEERMELSFSSGAGAWSTWLMLNSNGTFSGSFHDTNMGEIGDDYPNGTVYYCNFSGVFENIVQEDLFSYSMQMTALNCEDGEDGEELIEDGVRYVHSYPYGIEGGEEFILYRPEKAVEGLNEDFLSWWPDRYDLGEGVPWTLERFGLYNVNTGEGFFS